LLSHICRYYKLKEKKRKTIFKIKEKKKKKKRNNNLANLPSHDTLVSLLKTVGAGNPIQVCTIEET